MKTVKNTVVVWLTAVLFLFNAGIALGKTYYGRNLCSDPAYKCITVTKGQTWQQMFPDPRKRAIVQRVNRTNMYLWRGKKIAVPINLSHMTIFDVSPFPLRIENEHKKLIIVDQNKLAWGAYDATGHLVKWGAISSGKDYCSDIKGSCRTRPGIFYIFHKKDKTCRSRIFPVGRGGSHMPYCMFFYKGYALHGSPMVPGYRDSHGCVRLFTEDAKWLNEEFIDIATTANDFKGTKVIIQQLANTRKKGHDEKKSS